MATQDSHRTPTSFYSGRRSSAAARLIRSTSNLNHAVPQGRSSEDGGTPSRPRPFRNMSAPNFYGPGIGLGDFNFSNSDDSDEGPLNDNEGVEMQTNTHQFESPQFSVQPPSISLRSQASMSDEQSRNILTMLQQQQTLLQQVVTSQSRLENRQSTMEVKLADLKEKIDTPVVVSPTSSQSSDGKRKRIVTRALSVSL